MTDSKVFEITEGTNEKFKIKYIQYGKKDDMYVLALKKINYKFSKEIILNAKQYIEHIIKGKQININYDYFNKFIQESIEKTETAKMAFNKEKIESYHNWLDAAQNAFTICIYYTKVYLMYIIIVDTYMDIAPKFIERTRILRNILVFLLTPVDNTTGLIRKILDNITYTANELRRVENQKPVENQEQNDPLQIVKDNNDNYHGIPYEEHNVPLEVIKNNIDINDINDRNITTKVDEIVAEVEEIITKVKKRIDAPTNATDLSSK